MKKTVFFLWILALTVSVLPRMVCAGERTSCPEASLFSYGLTRYQEKQFDFAASGFDRFLFFCPEDDRRDTARMYLALCLKEQGDRDGAESLLREVSRSGEETLAAAAGLVLASLYAEAREAGQAALWAENVLRSTEDANLQALALWMSGGQYLLAGDLEGTALRWKGLPEEERARAEALWLAWQKRPEEGRKSPFLAGILGLFPGGGYFYTGRKQSGVLALTLTLGTGLAAWEAFDKEMPVLGTVFALLTLGFYGGSMKGGMEEARLTNRYLDDRYEADLMQKFRKDAVLPLEGSGIHLSLPF